MIAMIRAITELLLIILAITRKFDDIRFFILFYFLLKFNILPKPTFCQWVTTVFNSKLIFIEKEIKKTVFFNLKRSVSTEFLSKMLAWFLFYSKPE